MPPSLFLVVSIPFILLYYSWSMDLVFPPKELEEMGTLINWRVQMDCPVYCVTK